MQIDLQLLEVLENLKQKTPNGSMEIAWKIYIGTPSKSLEKSTFGL